uniref:Uncharacterized protein n=1 Tax=Dromaius novaehollandiae TaxID=8790 RepID=A0A8C4K4D3_DRONO
QAQRAGARAMHGSIPKANTGRTYVSHQETDDKRLAPRREATPTPRLATGVSHSRNLPSPPGVNPAEQLYPGTTPTRGCCQGSRHTTPSLFLPCSGPFPGCAL